MKARLAEAVAVLLAAAGVAWLHGPLFAAPGAAVAAGQFTGTHGWGIAHIAGWLGGDGTALAWTGEATHPRVAHAAFIAWGASLLAAPVEWWAGPVFAVNAATLLAPLPGVLVAAALARRLVGAGPVAAAAAGLVFALGPPVVGALANGQICKAETWALALGPLVVLGAAERWGAAALAGVAAAAAVFSEPTYAVIAAPVMAVLGVWAVAERPAPERRGAAVRVGVALAQTALVDLLARDYYAEGDGALHRPAAAVPLEDTALYLRQVALPARVVAGDGYVATDAFSAHVDYVGVPALLVLGAAVGVLWRGARGSAALALGGLAAAGLALALGEWAVTADGPLRVAGAPVPLPARALAVAGFPLADSGQYYRAIGLVWLAVAVGVGALGRLGRGGPALAVLAAGLVLGDGLRATAGLWPIPVDPLAGFRCLPAAPPTPRALPEDPLRDWHRGDEVLDPAGPWRLDLPRKRTLTESGRRLLATARDGLPADEPPVAFVRGGFAEHRLKVWVAAPDAAAMVAAMREDGVQRVISWEPTRSGAEERLLATLGVPDCVDRGVRVWNLAQTGASL
jgi:hypothetical protein